MAANQIHFEAEAIKILYTAKLQSSSISQLKLQSLNLTNSKGKSVNLLLKQLMNQIPKNFLYLEIPNLSLWT